MKKTTILLIVMLLMGILANISFAAEENVYFKMPITKMYAEPSKEANVIYQIPIEVKALGMTPDMNWFKIRISFDLIIFGRYTYEGWCYAPIGDLLRAREAGKKPVPMAPPELPF